MTRVLNFIQRMILGTVLMFVCFSPALAQEDQQCTPTLDNLPECITHHSGDISNHGIYNSLLAKADAAIVAHDRGQINTAINILNAFINEVSAQSSKKITTEAANHMIMHAQAAIDDLQ
jgi:hypothetical protein